MRAYVETQPKEGWRLEEIPDRCLTNWVSPYNRRLKSEVWLIGDSFIKQRTPKYRDIYDGEKVRLRGKFPEVVSVNGRKMYTDGHIHNMAARRMRKEFLKHLWEAWRKSEGLPVRDDVPVS